MTTYLSRLLLDSRCSAVRRDLADCHALHRRVLSGFPSAPNGAGARAHFSLLYRLEPEAGGYASRTLLVQSAVAPDWRPLSDGYLIAEPEFKPLDGVYDELEAGAAIRFRLRANPTRRISDTNASETERWRGRRVDLRTEESQVDWLRAKGRSCGFELVEVEDHPGVFDLRATPEGRWSGRPPVGSAKSERLTFSSVLFDGRLRITDAGDFRRAMLAGIGSGKAWGFGLLTIG